MRTAVDLAVELVEEEAARRGDLWLNVGVGVRRTLVAEQMLVSVVRRRVIAREWHFPLHILVGYLNARLIGCARIHRRLAALVVGLRNRGEWVTTTGSILFLVLLIKRISVFCVRRVLTLLISRFACSVGIMAILRGTALTGRVL